MSENHSAAGSDGADQPSRSLEVVLDDLHSGALDAIEQFPELGSYHEEMKRGQERDSVQHLRCAEDLMNLQHDISSESYYSEYSQSLRLVEFMTLAEGYGYSQDHVRAGEIINR